MAFPTLSKRGVKVGSRDPARVVNDNIRMVFKHRGGYATLETIDVTKDAKFPCYSQHVHGVLYRVSKDDMNKLITKEGGYVLKELEVETYDGKRVTAAAFVSSPFATLAGEVQPTEKYMRLLRDGASDNYLDPVYQAWLSSIETVPSVGLGPEYYNTPAKYIAYAFLAMVGLVVAGIFLHH
eukprot:jgi/Chrzof1/11046/Cz05g21180.t1